jgi:hypothetical protein
MTRPYTADTVSPVSALIYRAKTEHVDLTMIEGRVVYQAGRFSFVDREAVLNRLSSDLDRADHPDEITCGNLGRRLLPHIHEFYRDWKLPRPEPWYVLNGR